VIGAAAVLPLIEARGLRRSFEAGRVEALRGVDLRLAEGEFVAIQGPSGCGKSTLLQILGGLDEPTAGDVLFRGEPRRRVRDLAGFRARTVGFIFQSAHLLPTLTALENVQIPMFEMPWRPAERRDRARTLLADVGLGDRLGHRPPQLSGGERQRVAIARSLANEPRLLLADEPTGSLDSENARRILTVLRDVQTRHGVTLVVATHDAAVAAQADRVLPMLDGRL
jgi:ABC-type lipoprotein export system ATPase subunit